MLPSPPSSIHLHRILYTSTQLISASIQLSATPSTLLEPKYRMQLGSFPKLWSKNSTLSILTEHWHTWYLGVADSRSGLRLLKSDPKIHFWANLDRKSQSLGQNAFFVYSHLRPYRSFWTYS